MAFWKHQAAPGSAAALEEQKRAIARRGAWVVGFAHVAAVVILIVFSAGSLVGLTGDALTRAIAEAQGGVYDIPRAIEVLVSTLIVPAMDMAMLYAAIMIRMLRQRRQGASILHIAVMVVVSILEAATFVYMSAAYDNPGTNYALWAMIVARGIAAPLLATYLSLAAAPPVSSGDILYLTESLAADGVLNDTAAIAYDPTALTDDALRAYETRLSIWFPVAVMSPEDRARLDGLRAAVHAARAAQQLALSGPVVDAGVIATPDGPPDGPGGGITQETEQETEQRPSDGKTSRRTSNLRPFSRTAGNPRRLSPSAEAARKRRAFTYLDAQPGLTKTALRRKLRCAKGAADGYWMDWRATHAAQSTRETQAAG